MELKTARLTLLIDPNKKAAFERLCAQQDRTPSQVVRQFIRDYLASHGVEYAASAPPRVAKAAILQSGAHTKPSPPTPVKRPQTRRKA